MRASLALLLVAVVAAIRAAATPPHPALPTEPPLLVLSVPQGLGGGQARAVAAGGPGVLWCATAAGLDQLEGERPARHYAAGSTVLLPDRRVTALLGDDSTQVWVGTYDGLVALGEGWHTQLTRQEGLPDERVTVAAAARDGTRWFGTWGGLARWASGRLEGPGAELPAAAVLALLADEGGQAWVGYLGHGLWRQTPAGVHPVPAPRGSGPLTVSALLQTLDGTVWAGTAGQGVLAVSRGELQPAGLDGRSVLGLWSLRGEAGQREVWAGTDTGLYRLVEGAWREVPGPGRAAVIVVRQGEDGPVWAGTWGSGLWAGDAGGLAPEEGLAGRQVSDVLLETGGRVWAATDSGLLVGIEGPGGGWRRVEVEDGRPAGAVRSLLSDGRGRVWAGTYEDGLLRVHEDRAVRLHPEYHLPEAAVHAIATAGRDLWLATQAGVVHFDGEVFRPVPWAGAGAPPVAQAVAVVPGQGVLAGTSAGLARVDGGRLLPVDLGAGVTVGRVRALAAAADGGLWLGTDQGVVCWDGRGGVTRLGREQGLPHDQVQALLAERGGRLWVGTPAGLAVVAQDRVRTYRRADGMTSELVTCLAGDRRGGVWIGTLGGGAMRWDGKGFRRLTGREGLPSNIVRQIAQDQDGHVWLATDKGLCRYHRDALPAGPGCGPAAVWTGLALLLVALAGVAAWRRRHR
ncbi:MAG: two-component regulator propeller domain-containing protein, partial [Candidatus Latescibacterota bacterium]